MRTVILDTNMLLVPGQHKVDIFAELERLMEEPYEILIIGQSMEELEKIAAKRTDDGRAAQLAKLLIAHHQKPKAGSRCKALKTPGRSGNQYADDAILAIADDDTFVATNDAALKRRLVERGVRVIFLKQQQYLVMG